MAKEPATEKKEDATPPNSGSAAISADGLTMRDRFALGALSGLLSAAPSYAGAERLGEAAERAYALADAMIEQRKAKRAK